MGLALLYLKFDSPNIAFTHTLNNLRYYLNCGIVILICSSIIFVKPKLKVIAIAFLITLPLNILLKVTFPEINYFVRAFLVILSSLVLALLFNIKNLASLNSFLRSSSIINNYVGLILLISLILLHIIFH